MNFVFKVMHELIIHLQNKNDQTEREYFLKCDAMNDDNFRSETQRYHDSILSGCRLCQSYLYVNTRDNCKICSRCGYVVNDPLLNASHGYFSNRRWQSISYNRVTYLRKWARVHLPNSPSILTKKLFRMYASVEKVFFSCCPAERTNFFHTNYVMRKLLCLLGERKYLKRIKKMKSARRIANHERIWSKICEKLGWEYKKEH